MKATSSTIARLLSIALVLSGTLPAHADYTQQVLIEQQRDECRRLGGRYEYPKCYMPESTRAQPSQSESTCGLGCGIFLGVAALAASRIAYCKANPGKC